MRKDGSVVNKTTHLQRLSSFPRIPLGWLGGSQPLVTLALGKSHALFWLVEALHSCLHAQHWHIHTYKCKARTQKFGWGHRNTFVTFLYFDSNWRNWQGGNEKQRTGLLDFLFLCILLKLNLIELLLKGLGFTLNAYSSLGVLKQDFTPLFGMISFWVTLRLHWGLFSWKFMLRVGPQHSTVEKWWNF